MKRKKKTEKSVAAARLGSSVAFCVRPFLHIRLRAEEALLHGGMFTADLGVYVRIFFLCVCLSFFNRRVGNQIYTRKLATGIPGYSTRFDAKN